MNGLTI